jgi:hypothetical protein
MRIVTEEDLAAKLISYLREKQKLEIRIECKLYDTKFSKQIDVIGFNNIIINGYETKLDDTAGVIKQAEAHRPHVNESWAVMKYRQVQSRTEKLLEDSGVGLLLIEDEPDVSGNEYGVVVAHNAKRNPRPSGLLDIHRGSDNHLKRAGAVHGGVTRARQVSSELVKYLKENKGIVTLSEAVMDTALGYANPKLAKAAIMNMNRKNTLEGCEVIGSGSCRMLQIKE